MHNDNPVKIEKYQKYDKGNQQVNCFGKGEIHDVG
jgi:hypothetical protein